MATAPSAVCAIFSNVEANVVLLKVFKARATSRAFKPDCANTTLVLAITFADIPNSLEREEISLLRPLRLPELTL